MKLSTDYTYQELEAMSDRELYALITSPKTSNFGLLREFRRKFPKHYIIADMYANQTLSDMSFKLTEEDEQVGSQEWIKDTYMEYFCRKAVRQIDMPDDYESWKRWCSCLLASGYFQVQEVVDMCDLGTHDNNLRLVKSFAKGVANYTCGNRWLMRELLKRGHSFQDYITEETASARRHR